MAKMNDQGEKVAASDKASVRFFDLEVGQVLDIGRRWIVILFVEDNEELFLMTSSGDTVPIKMYKVETKVFGDVWVSRMRVPNRLRLRVELPNHLSASPRTDDGGRVQRRRRLDLTDEEVQRLAKRLGIKAEHRRDAPA